MRYDCGREVAEIGVERRSCAGAAYTAIEAGLLKIVPVRTYLLVDLISAAV